MWFYYLAAIGGAAALLYAAGRLVRSVPRPYRRHGVGQIQQAVDHRFGRFGGSYPEEVVRREGVPQIGRNDPCPCGSDRKYKRCCGR
jgi:hypothetical protein